MGATTGGRHVERHIEDGAIGRVLDHLHRERTRGVGTFPLAELAEATALDPSTAADVLTFLEDTGPFVVERAPIPEIAWTVRGSPYDLNGWESGAWNCPDSER